MNRYTATAPDGQVVTTYSGTKYSHAVMLKNQDTGRWLATWAANLESAQKQALQNQANCTWISRVEIVKAMLD
jgi:hypothetical protein